MPLLVRALESGRQAVRQPSKAVLVRMQPRRQAGLVDLPRSKAVRLARQPRARAGLVLLRTSQQRLAALQPDRLVSVVPVVLLLCWLVLVVLLPIPEVGMPVLAVLRA